VDPHDEAEKELLAKLNVASSTPEAVTVFLSPPGTVAGTFKGPTDTNALAALVKNPPPGCGATKDCDPSKDCGSAKK